MKSPIFEVSRFLKSGRNLRVCCGVAAVVLLLVRSPQCRVRGRAVVVRRYGGFSAQSCSDTGPRHIFTTAETLEMCGPAGVTRHCVP